MKKSLLLVMIMLVLSFTSCSKKDTDEEFILVTGGMIDNSDSIYNQTTVEDFYLGKYEVTQKEWTRVMGTNPSNFQGESLPVESISWYDCLEYCNKRSEQEGYTPFYIIDQETIDPNNQSEYDTVKWTVTVNEESDGYRLPTEAEWEYAAFGGSKSKSTTYSGSDDPDIVSWNWHNAGNEYLTGDWSWPSISENQNRTHPVGTKEPNELGLYDMSGNVREWCWDWFEDSVYPTGMFRVWKGGGWLGDVVCCAPTYRGKFEANGFGGDQGFRICRSAKK